MKSLGTITMCFPYVDEETRTVLQSVMEQAENITDFAEKLCDRVCEESTPKLLEYFAVYFPFYIEYYALIYRLHSEGKTSDLTYPLVMLSKGWSGDVGWDDMRAAMLRALEMSPNDWITCHLYLAWRSVAEVMFPESDLEIRPIEAIISTVNENRDLAFFKSVLLYLDAESLRRNFKRVEAVGVLRKALTIAKEFDEQIMVADLLGKLAEIIKHADLDEAIRLFNSSREISEKLGYNNRVGRVQHQLGHVRGIRGELDAAIEGQTEYKMIRQSLGLTTFWMDAVIAFYYNQIGNGKRAYELAKAVYDLGDTVIRHFSYLRVQLVWALINLGRIDEAKTELSAAQTIARRTGDSRELMWCRLVEGVLDKAESRFEGAIECFREVLKILEGIPAPVVQNICYINLTEIEIDKLADESLEKNSESSGPWMQKLVEHAEKNDLPGVAARALVLKAELRRKQGRIDEVHNILKEVQETAKAPSMKYLNELTITRFPEIVLT